MVFNTLTVGAAVTPSVIETYFSHYLHRAPLRQKPTAHISYHEGLRMIREFLDYSSKHTVEDIQAFTGQWVPAPHWVRINDAEIAPKFLERAAELIQDQLGPKGVEKIGGDTWWQWRRPESPLRAEWIEMKKEYHERKRTGEKCERVILYVHGGAYYFGSVDEHRYQMQRHARKLRARVLSPRYRLAPQFPFPCGLYDCLATYYYLLEHFEPSEILFAGDSAGGGMVLSMLVTLRDQEQPMPAGTILLSPWVDLTHSFPSVAGDGVGDYIPPHGFQHKPSMTWPPPPSDGVKKSSGNYGAPTDAVELPATAGLDMKHRKRNHVADDEDDEELSALPKPKNQEPITALPSIGDNLKIMLDGQPVEMKEQIQLYTTNELLAHPLVSPVLQPSLGGLPPMLIQVGGAELLKDEQIYLAHKAANPKAYPSNEAIMNDYDPQREIMEMYPPTDVQLQVWEDLCHVPHTLSFTRPAKYMYRSVAQFGAWAFAHAQHKGIEIQNDDAVSFISSGGEEDDDDKSIAESTRKEATGSADTDNMSTLQLKLVAMGAVGKAGDPLPPFKDHMIRQRVTRHGVLYPLAPSSEIASLALDPASVGVIKPAPVRKWLAAKSANEQRFANEKKKIQKKRAKEIAAGYDEIPGEQPPPTALVNRRRKGVAPEEKKKGRSWGLAMWSGWGSSHDEHTLQREQKTEKEATRKASVANALDSSKTENGNLAVPDGGADTRKKRRTSSASMFSTQLPWSRDKERPRSPYRQVNDSGQADTNKSRATDAPIPASSALSGLNRPASATESMLTTRPVSFASTSPIPIEQDRGREHEAPIPTTSAISPNSEKIPGSENTYLSPTSRRPHNGVQAFPFKLRDRRSNPSIATMDSQAPGGTSTPASGAHSELVGDAPQPVELPSTFESKEELEQFEAAGSAAEQSAESSQGTPSSSSSPKPGAAGTLEPPKSEAAEDAVSPLDAATKDEAEEGPSPLETPKPGMPFKLRNTIFDPRTSMLGSIGADGMPNKHHSFAPSPSSENAPPAPAAKVEAGKPTEATKVAPFKLRHTVYDPNVTLVKAPEEAMPSQVPKQETAARNEDQRQSDVAQPEPARQSAGSSDQPPSYDSSIPVTNIIIPETVPKRPIVKEREEDDDDIPPPPPPKDKKHLVNRKPTNREVNEEAKTNGASVPRSKFSAAPIIGDLSFEKGEEEKRPQLETFVTASDGRDLKEA